MRCPEELLTAALARCRFGCVASPCYQGPLFWVATRALMHKIKNTVAAYFPSGEEKTSSKSIALTSCVNDITCGSSSHPCRSGCLWSFPTLWTSRATAEHHVLWVFFSCVLAKLLGADRRTWQLGTSLWSDGGAHFCSSHPVPRRAERLRGLTLGSLNTRCLQTRCD